MTKAKSYAPRVLRLINFLIDSLFILLIIFSIAYIVGYYGVSFNSYVVNYIYSTFLILVSFIGYYLILEFKFQTTIGKLLTRTYVVNLEGSKPSFSNVLKRTLIRLIPIELLSFLFSKNGWHDKLSKTKVLKKLKSEKTL